jgi:hypothetical protein
VKDPGSFLAAEVAYEVDVLALERRWGGVGVVGVIGFGGRRGAGVVSVIVFDAG